ncbi:MAG: hypothetical protein KDB40_20145 [Acidimicrobiales bacterium]|nr:hypothetical protein [Acidimicrobiales bacterium]
MIAAPDEVGNTSRTPGTKVLARRRHLTRLVWSTALVTLVLGASPAAADPPRPTDYRSEIVAISPSVPGLEARIIGGDSFIELTTSGHDVVVLGYDREPYLHFDADGTVRENVRSPARWLNLDRYSESSVPPEADASAPPEWEPVGSGGRYAWHDHRTHWMVEVPPFGLGPGDQILDGVIPLVVDGEAVEISVRSVWMPGPSWVPWLLAAVVAAVAGAIVVAFGARRPRVGLGLVTAAAAMATIVGVWQTRSVPSETGPPITHWALPVSAVVIGVAALVGPWSAFTRRGAALVVAVQLAVWTVLRLDVLDHAILPTSAPFWLDRVVTAVTGVWAVIGAYAAIVAIVRSMYAAPAGGPTPA